MRIYADAVVVDKISDNGVYDTLHNIGELCRLDNSHDEAVQTICIVVEDLRSDMLQRSCTKLQATLAFTLGTLANVHVHRHHYMMHEGKHAVSYEYCYFALDLLREAIDIWDALSHKDHLSHALLRMGTVCNDLGFFEDAQTFLHRALILANQDDHAKDTMHMAACHQQLAANCLGKAIELRKQLRVHQMFLTTNSMTQYHSRFNTVRVTGLQNSPQYNGLEAAVRKVGTKRLTVVLLGEYLHKNIKIKPENAGPLLRTPADVCAKTEEIQQLTALQIKSSTASNALQLKTSGDKHINSAITCQTLATAHLKMFAQDNTTTALKLLLKANRIRLRIEDENEEKAQTLTNLIREARNLLTEFETPGFLSPVTCCWPPTSREQDEANMGQLFVALQERAGNHPVSSEAAEHCLRFFGLPKVAVAQADSVSQADFVAAACEELHRMKLYCKSSALSVAKTGKTPGAT